MEKVSFTPLSGLAEQKGTSLLIVGSSEGSGASTSAKLLAQEYARLGIGAVAILDLDGGPTSISANPAYREIVENAKKTGLNSPINIGNVHLVCAASPSRSDEDSFASTLHRERVVAQIADLKSRYGLVVGDVRSDDRSREALMFAQHFDGVLLLANQNATKMVALRNLKTRLEQAGATVLGAILNRRRLALPNWVYQRI